MQRKRRRRGENEELVSRVFCVILRSLTARATTFLVTNRADHRMSLGCCNGVRWSRGRQETSTVNLEVAP
jgi:hypothetical protein